MIWLLDTNIVIHAIRFRPPSVRQRLGEVSPDDVRISSITIAELWYGAEKYNAPARRRTVLEAFLEPYAILSFDRAAGELHGHLRHAMRHHPIGERDLLIAAIALANDLTVVTNNTREFARVPELRVEDWSV